MNLCSILCQHLKLVLENAEKERKYLNLCKVRLDPLDEHLQAVSKTIKEFQTLTRAIAERLSKKQNFFTTLYVGMKLPTMHQQSLVHCKALWYSLTLYCRGALLKNYCQSLLHLFGQFFSSAWGPRRRWPIFMNGIH